MKKNKQLAATVATVMAVAILSGTSAIAETRPEQETWRRGDARESVRREHSQADARGDESRNDAQQEVRREDARAARADRYDGSRATADDRGYDRGRGSNGNRGGQYNRGGGAYNNSKAYHHNGRVTKYSKWNNGYRVWVAGAPYPYYVPLSHWHHNKFRVGAVINIGGYYNPAGYYDYYDGYGYRSTSRGDLRGTVESVDYGRQTFVVRNEATGSFVTIIGRDRYDRDVRPGDYVQLSGAWTRSGLFEAYDVDLLDAGRRYGY